MDDDYSQSEKRDAAEDLGPVKPAKKTKTGGSSAAKSERMVDG